jgi:hypothetical protein
MGPINNLPLGFLDLLGLQQQGRNLSLISDAVSGTLDLLPHYAAYKRTFVREDTAFGGPGSSNVAVATVPTGEYWFVLGGMIQNGSGAGATGYAQLEFLIEGRTVFVSDRISMAFADLNLATQVNLKTTVPTILPPGSLINKAGYGLAAPGSGVCYARLAYLPLRG